jgi:ribA/ribD-fused uncharacterized protein
MDDMKPYAIHDANNVRGFFGEYRWMSNFFICPTRYEGIEYQSSENAYQAAKVKPEYRIKFVDVQPYVAKKMWKKYPLVDTSTEEWNARKFEVMVQIVFDKFLINKDLRINLVRTNGLYLEETNDWGDVFFGYDVEQKRGKNFLGKILMSTRSYWMTLYKDEINFIMAKNKTETKVLSNVTSNIVPVKP